jgi:hypothetical protein
MARFRTRQRPSVVFALAGRRDSASCMTPAQWFDLDRTVRAAAVGTMAAEKYPAEAASDSLSSGLMRWRTISTGLLC